MKSKPGNNFNFNTYVPFSRSVDHSELISIAQQLLEKLKLSAKIHFVKGNAQSGLDLERCFRIMWWTTGDEPLRLALHQSKIRIHRHSHITRKDKQLTEALRDTEHVLRLTPWRQHLHNLIKKNAPKGQSYLRLLFRAAQQVCSRAARWHAVMPPDAPSPFVSLIELMSAGVWPMGCHDGSLLLFLWNETATEKIDFGPSLISPQTANQKDYIFLSALFQNSELTMLWKEIFRDKGWNTMHGPVDEDVAPPEVQLGKQIQESRAVVGLLPEPDPDLGIPWWMYQELDYASACNRPVILITQCDSAESELKNVQKINLELDNQSKIIGKHELWEWIQKNAV